MGHRGLPVVGILSQREQKAKIKNGVIFIHEDTNKKTVQTSSSINRARLETFETFHFLKLLQVEGWLKSKRQYNVLYILTFCHNDSLIKIGQKDRNPNIVMFKSDSLWNSQFIRYFGSNLR